MNDAEKRYRLKNKIKINLKASLLRKTKEYKRYAFIYHLKQFHGISFKLYSDLIQKQNGRCAICNRFLIGLHTSLDHDHKTNQIRAILCQQCNLGLGAFYDRPDVLRKAASYLEWHCEEPI